MPDDPGNFTLPQPCGICSGLRDEEYAFQKFGASESDTHLPAAAGSLILVQDVGSRGSRELQLWQCPACSTYYLYRTDYEYLVNGTEDEQFLTRLAPDQAREYLK
jgi:hypothetical protein